jgi:hypothetical protein
MPLSRIQTTLISGETSDSVLRSLLVPAAPTSVSGISGDSQITLSWTAFAAPSITDYNIQYSSDSGSTWTTFSDGVSTAQSVIVTGLTNGTSYVFRVSAINDIGTGPFSTMSAPVVVGSDLLFNNVSLLLNMNGESSTFIDSSPRQKTITTIGSVSQLATQSKWGGKSGYFAGDGTRLTTPDNDDFYFGSEDYVVEAWLYIPVLNTSGGGNIFSQSANLGNNANRQYAFAVNSGGLVVYWTTDGANDNSLVFSTTPPTNQWIYVAFSRSNQLLRAYLNGVRVGNPIPHNVTYYNSSAHACVGSFGGYAVNGYSFLDFTGFIDDLRVTKGSDRGYTGATIAVPTAPFPAY